MIPFSPRLNIFSVLKKKRNYWNTIDSEHQFLLSRSSWSLLAICLLRKNFSSNKKINLFLPEYFCNDPIPLLNSKIINIIYYEIDKDFKPSLKSLNKQAEINKPDIFLCVHYFGQPIVLNELKNFCIKHKSWYVEDATHCLKKDSIIGRQGDFVMFSLYKHLPLPDGAVLLIREKGPSKLNLESVRKIKINNFLEEELSELNFNKTLIQKNSNIRSIIWISKKILTFCFQNTTLLNNYLIKNYIKSLNLNYGFQSYSYKISILSKWLFDRFDLENISKIKLRNQFIFKNILKDYVNILPNFDLKLNYLFHTPYILPITLRKGQTPLDLINKGIPIVKWPLLPESNFEINEIIKKKFNNNYFLIIHHSIKHQNFKNLLEPKLQLGQIELRKNKIDTINWNKIALKTSNFNILQSWAYGLSKSIIEKKKIDRYEILINKRPVGFFQILSKTYFKIFEIKRINRGPILIDNLSIENKIKIFEKILKLGNIFKRKILSISPEISFFSIESIFFKSNSLFKLPIPNWKSSIILLENELDFIAIKLKPKWRNALNFSKKQNIKINISQTSDGIDGVLKKYNELTTKKNFNGINPELIREISLIKNKFEQLHTLEAFKDDEIVALIVISAQSKNSIYLIGWTNDLGRKLNANNLLLWEAIIYLKQEKYKTFDLGGLIGNNHPIDLFKLGLNGSYYENTGEFIKF